MMRTKILKVISTVTVIMVTLVITVVPCFAQFSGDSPNGSFTYDPTIAFATFEYDSNHNYVNFVGNQFSTSTLFDDYDDFIQNSNKIIYSTVGDISGGINWTTADGSWNPAWWPEWDYNFMYGLLYSTNTDLIWGVDFETTRRLYQYDVDFDDDALTCFFTALSSYITVTVIDEYQAWELVGSDYQLVDYRYSTTTTGAQAQVGAKYTTRASSEAHFADFLIDSGLLNSSFPYFYHTQRVTVDFLNYDPDTADPVLTGYGGAMIGAMSDWMPVSESSLRFPSTNDGGASNTNWLNWLFSFIDNFLTIEFLPGISFGSLILIVIAVPALLAVLRLLGGVG